MITIRSEGIGSLLRPPYLLDARPRLERGELTPAEFNEGNRVSPGDQRRKLDVVAETARAVWPAHAPAA